MIKINYAHNFTFLSKSFYKFRKWTFINVQNGKIKTLLEKIFYIIKIPSNYEDFLQTRMVCEIFRENFGHFL